MTDGFNFIAIAQTHEIADGISQVVDAIGGMHAEVRQRHNGTPIMEVLSDSPSDILLIDLDLTDADAVKELERIIQERGKNSATLVTSTEASIQDVRALLRLGVQDFLPQPFTREELASTLKETISQLGKNRSSSGASNGKIITFIRSCGGVGATSLALELAADLNERSFAQGTGTSVGVMDFDLQFGNADLALDLVPSTSILDVIDSNDRLDPSFLMSAMTVHHSGVQVLSSPDHILPLDALTPTTAANLLSVARKCFDFTIVDMPHAWASWTHPVLSASDMIVLVMEPTVTSVHRSQSTLSAIRSLEVDDVPLALVANKIESTMTAKQRLSEASEALKLEIAVSVRADTKNMDEARNRGVFLKDVSDRSPALKDMRQLGDLVQSQLAPEMAEHAEIKSGSLLTKFRRK
jgi:pilus assembly protein CpaE